VWHTNGFITIQSFYTTADSVPCDKYFIGGLGSGVISHYNYPFNTTERLNCNYQIFIPYIPPQSSWRICFQFRRFSLADSEICSDDYLRFPDWYTYCGQGRAMASKPKSDPMTNIFYSQLCCTYCFTTLLVSVRLGSLLGLIVTYYFSLIFNLPVF